MTDSVQTTLFDLPKVQKPQGKSIKVHEDYEGFVNKFKPKKTTDDCYTPPIVYDAVADWVASQYRLNRADFVRPFYPGGDYERYNYPENCIVVDNPPFSILSEIVRFYCSCSIRFFLFAPALTCANIATECTFTILATGASVIYENGANVSTSFVTNLDDPAIKLRSCPDLYRTVEDSVNRKEKARTMTKYIYPDNIVTAAMVNNYSKYGVDFCVRAGEFEKVKVLDSQRPLKKTIFGGGYLLAEKAAAEKAAAEKAAAEKAAAIHIELSEREKAIIRRLS